MTRFIGLWRWSDGAIETDAAEDGGGPHLDHAAASIDANTSKPVRFEDASSRSVRQRQVEPRLAAAIPPLAMVAQNNADPVPQALPFLRPKICGTREAVNVECLACRIRRMPS